MKDFLQGVAFLLIGASWLVYGHTCGYWMTKFAYISMFFFSAVCFTSMILSWLASK